MEITSLILSIIASLFTIISVIITLMNRREVQHLKQKLESNSNSKNIDNRGRGNFNNTGDNNTIQR